MITCIFIEHMLPDYIEGGLPHEKMKKIDRHLKTCVRCRETVETIRLVARAQEDSPVPETDAEFWHGFRTELDNKLNRELNGDARLFPRFPRLPKPVLAFAGGVLVVLLAFGILSLPRSGGEADFYAQSDEAIAEEILLVEELSGEQLIVEDVEAFLSELYFCYEMEFETA